MKRTVKKIKKRTYYSIQEKINILNSIKSGISHREIMKSKNLTRILLNDWTKKEKILNEVENKNKKTVHSGPKCTEIKNQEKILKFINKENRKNNKIYTSDIIEIILKYNPHLKSKKRKFFFGWIYRFIIKNGIFFGESNNQLIEDEIIDLYLKRNYFADFSKDKQLESKISPNLEEENSNKFKNKIESFIDKNEISIDRIDFTHLNNNPFFKNYINNDTQNKIENYPSYYNFNLLDNQENQKNNEDIKIKDLINLINNEGNYYKKKNHSFLNNINNNDYTQKKSRITNSDHVDESNINNKIISNLIINNNCFLLNKKNQNHKKDDSNEFILDEIYLYFLLKIKKSNKIEIQSISKVSKDYKINIKDYFDTNIVPKLFKIKVVYIVNIKSKYIFPLINFCENKYEKERNSFEKIVSDSITNKDSGKNLKNEVKSLLESLDLSLNEGKDEIDDFNFSDNEVSSEYSSNNCECKLFSEEIHDDINFDQYIAKKNISECNVHEEIDLFNLFPNKINKLVDDDFDKNNNFYKSIIKKSLLGKIQINQINQNIHLDNNFDKCEYPQNKKEINNSCINKNNFENLEFSKENRAKNYKKLIFKVKKKKDKKNNNSQNLNNNEILINYNLNRLDNNNLKNENLQNYVNNNDTNSSLSVKKFKNLLKNSNSNYKKKVCNITKNKKFEFNNINYSIDLDYKSSKIELDDYLFNSTKNLNLDPIMNFIFYEYGMKKNNVLVINFSKDILYYYYRKNKFFFSNFFDKIILIRSSFENSSQISLNSNFNKNINTDDVLNSKNNNISLSKSNDYTTIKFNEIKEKKLIDSYLRYEPLKSTIRCKKKRLKNLSDFKILNNQSIKSKENNNIKYFSKEKNKDMFLETIFKIKKKFKDNLIKLLESLKDIPLNDNLLNEKFLQKNDNENIDFYFIKITKMISDLILISFTNI